MWTDDGRTTEASHTKSSPGAFSSGELKACQLVKDLTAEKQGRSITVQDKSGKCLTEEQEILSRWTEYCSELYNYKSYGDNTVLDCSQHPEEAQQPKPGEEVEIAIAPLKKGEVCKS